MPGTLKTPGLEQFKFKVGTNSFLNIKAAKEPEKPIPEHSLEGSAETTAH